MAWNSTLYRQAKLFTALVTPSKLSSPLATAERTKVSCNEVALLGPTSNLLLAKPVSFLESVSCDKVLSVEVPLANVELTLFSNPVVVAFPGTSAKPSKVEVAKFILKVVVAGWRISTSALTTVELALANGVSILAKVVVALLQVPSTTAVHRFPWQYGLGKSVPGVAPNFWFCKFGWMRKIKAQPVGGNIAAFLLHVNA